MGFTQSQAVSTTTGTLPRFPQLVINIVIRHMVNSLLYIAGLFCYFNPVLGSRFSGCGMFFGALLFSFGLSDDSSS